MMLDLKAREAELLDAHAAGDLAKLVQLYSERAREIEADDLDAACFYMTNAYVFALDLGLAQANGLHAFLLKHQREEAHAPI